MFAGLAKRHQQLGEAICLPNSQTQAVAETRFEAHVHKVLGTCRWDEGGGEEKYAHHTRRRIRRKLRAVLMPFMQYTTCHYIALHRITLHHIIIMALNYIPFPSLTLHCIHITSHYITLHYTILHNPALRYPTLKCVTVHCISLHCVALHCVAFHIALHSALHDMTLHCITLHYTRLRYSTLPYPCNYHYLLQLQVHVQEQLQVQLHFIIHCIPTQPQNTARALYANVQVAWIRLQACRP